MSTGVRVIAVVLLGLFSAGRVLAHGARYVAVDGATAVRAIYDDDRPMAFADVSVFGPGNSETPFLKGSTDRHGHFAFVPDQPGQWQVRVDDGMGHVVSIPADVDEHGLCVADSAGESRLTRSLVGIGAILGIFGGASLFLSLRHRVHGHATGVENHAHS